MVTDFWVFGETMLKALSEILSVWHSGSVVLNRGFLCEPQNVENNLPFSQFSQGYC